jgi:hypothetical protein
MLESWLVQMKSPSWLPLPGVSHPTRLALKILIISPIFEQFERFGLVDLLLIASNMQIVLFHPNHSNL